MFVRPKAARVFSAEDGDGASAARVQPEVA